MNRFIRYLQNYLMIGLPFVVICIVWGSLGANNMEKALNYSPFTKMIWSGFGYNIMLWFTLLIVYLFALVLIPSVREKTLRRLANMKERDEREQYITGKASRAAYISTLSILILFLFISLFSFNVIKTPADKAGHHYRASIGMHYTMLNSSVAPSPAKNAEEILFDTNQYTLSSSSILLILLAWQLFIFNRAARKEQ